MKQSLHAEIAQHKPLWVC